MPKRPDLRVLTTNVREAFADADRETLLDVLSFVVREYVVEGPPPMLVHAVEDLADLSGLTFSQLVTALQTRLPHPELALFSVDGDQVSVRVGGVAHPLRPGAAATVPAAPAPPTAAATRPEAAAAPRSPTAAPIAAPAAASAPAPGREEPARGVAPRPTQGLAVRGRPNEGGPATSQPPPSRPSSPPPSAPPSSAPPATTPAPVPPASAAEGKEPSGDDSSTRFSLLELD